MLQLSWLAHDLRVVARVLRRQPRFALTALSTLGLALGATLVILTVVDRTLIRPLPYPHDNQLVALYHRDLLHGRNDKATGAEVTAWEARRDLFDRVGFSWDAQFTLGATSNTSGHALSLRAFQFSSDMFTLLGVRPALGRVFVPTDALPGADHVVILSDHLWRSALGASPTIVGHVIRLDDSPYVVIGVMPPDFAHPDAMMDLWTPLRMPPELASNNALHAFSVVARLQPGVTGTAATAALGRGVAIQSLRDAYLGFARPVLLVLEGAVVLLLLIAVVNVSNLILAYALQLQDEFALRRALGATRVRLVAHCLVFGLVLSAAGSGLAFVLASFGIDAVRFAFANVVTTVSPSVATGLSTGALVMVGAGAVAVAMILAGLLAMGSRAISGLAASSNTRRGSASREALRARGALVAIELALAVALLAGSGLLVESYLNLGQRAFGFGIADRLTFVLRPPAPRYPDAVSMTRYVDAVLERISALPGVQSVAATSAIPLSGMDARRRLPRLGAADSTGDGVVHYHVVSTRYFATMGIPLRNGRGFSDADRAGAPEVAVINETLARTRWPTESPIGKTLIVHGGPTAETVRIVGIVGDVRADGLASEPQPELYRPLQQAFWPFLGIIVHMSHTAAPTVKSIEEAVWSIDRAQPIDRVTALAQLAADSVALRRVSMILLSAFAVAAALLAALGIYGVVAYSVALRTREIGIRVALGATPREILQRILASGLRLAGVGAAAGIVIAIALTRSLASLLFGVRPTDTATLIGAALVTVGVAVLASYLPARRAMGIDPAAALRHE